MWRCRTPRWLGGGIAASAGVTAVAMLAAVERSRTMPGGDLEYRVLTVLWELGSASVREIYDRVGERDGLVYTTIAKIVDRLHAKRLVARQRAGAAFVYRPAIRRATVDRYRARAVLDRLLGVEPRPAIATLVNAIATIDPDLLDDLSREIRRWRRRGS